MVPNRILIYFLFSSLAVSAFVSPPEDDLRRENVIVRQLQSLSSTSSAPASRTDTTTTTSIPSSVSSVVSSLISGTGTSSRVSSDGVSAPPTVTEPTQAITSLGISTDAQGHTVTSFIVVPPSASASASPTPSQSSSSDGGLGTGSIVGLSVAGGIAVLGVIVFLVWKLKRKRFSEFDDNEAIKWPELNAHGGDTHALPVHNTGRAGFDTGSESSFSRAPSTDPYAVPPLPHLDPSQPYRDDPSATGYYDNPNTFNETDSMDVSAAQGWSNAEAIPMTQMSRARSPGSQMSYDAGAAGRHSPGPQFAYGQGGFIDDRSRSPGPGVGLGGMPPAGRRSPGPQAAYEPSINIPR